MITTTYNTGHYKIHCWLDTTHWRRVKLERMRRRDLLTRIAIGLLGAGPARW